MYVRSFGRMGDEMVGVIIFKGATIFNGQIQHRFYVFRHVFDPTT